MTACKSRCLQAPQRLHSAVPRIRTELTTSINFAAHGRRSCSIAPCTHEPFARHFRGLPRTQVATSEVTAGPSQAQVARKRRINGLKLRLLSQLASLDRGLAANGKDAREVEELVQLLEATEGPVTLTWSQPPATEEASKSTMEKLQGTWKLLYTSAFTTGSLGGRRPGPPAALVPFTLGQVYQIINAAPDKASVDNVVEFILAAPPPFSKMLSGFPRSNAAESVYNPPNQDQYQEQPALRLTLKHRFDVKGTHTVEVTYEDTTVELYGNSFLNQLPKLDLPQLPEPFRPPKNLRSATFQVVFLDERMRITRGDRQELRVYVRADSMITTDPTGDLLD